MQTRGDARQTFSLWYDVRRGAEVAVHSLNRCAATRFATSLIFPERNLNHGVIDLRLAVTSAYSRTRFPFTGRPLRNNLLTEIAGRAPPARKIQVFSHTARLLF